MEFYGPLKDEWFEKPPSGVKRQPDEGLYQGQRLLVVRGIKAAYGAYARLEYDSFSFRHTIYCVPLASLPEWEAKLILAVFWSSLGRYRMFMTSGSWGAWYDQTVPRDILSMPVRIPPDQNETTQAVVEAVDSIRSWEPLCDGLFEDREPTVDSLPLHLLERLDQGVLDLFGLSEAQRDLVNDFTRSTFDLFSNGVNSGALRTVNTVLDPLSGTISCLPRREPSQDELAAYLRTFLDIWNRELAPQGEFAWRVIRSEDIPMIAVVFTTQEREALPADLPLFGDTVPFLSPTHGDLNANNSMLWLQEIDYPLPLGQEPGWDWVLETCEAALRQPISRRIYVEGMIRAVTDTFIIIIKRDERRLWTRSMAREDAEAALLQAVNLQQQARVAQ